MISGRLQILKSHRRVQSPKPAAGGLEKIGLNAPASDH
jgi:hypothetical protein